MKNTDVKTEKTDGYKWKALLQKKVFHIIFPSKITLFDMNRQEIHMIFDIFIFLRI